MLKTETTIRHALASLGKFSILQECDEGANAYAFRAHHRTLHRDAFLKVYDYDENAALAEALREPQTLVAASVDGDVDSL